MSATTTTTTSPPRATRPSHPRPTTYSGVPTASHGPPIEPPPRTSSQRQVPIAVNGRPGSSRGAPPADGANEVERERRRETLPAQPVGRANSTSRRAGSSSSRANGNGVPQQQQHQQQHHHQPQPVERQGSRRAENGASRSGAGSSHSQQMQPLTQQRGTNGRKETRFGDYILGQTLGEGEFGKVKLGWRRDGGVQVAIKLIRRDSVSPHPNRLSKIYREIAILRTLSHPNIVRLHEMVETDRHIGIILEYASGGELFDYILKHRYLKDPPACRLFAQLVSGVGYLHKKGIVHRDLKLENLLLDRNRNIIITDFGFANVFDPKDELKPEEEARLNEPGYLKELEKGIHPDRAEDGSSLLSIIGPGQARRRGDLMVTSCGSPCYAAPELVVSDGLYTGRKVDVWSCGVILYAMLAGYLPFDDDPANPDGDNINLLYKYIVSTPLTFPEYVTPHARDLLRRILVPDPRKRADLFEVARHSWLNPFADIVNKVTSATTPLKDVETATVDKIVPSVQVPKRSNSVRAPATHSNAVAAGMYGGLHHTADQIIATAPKPSSDNKRRTVQVEYVKPVSETKRASAVDADEVDDAAPAPVVSTNKDTSGLSRSATNAGTSGRSFAKFMDGKKARDDKIPGPEKGKTRPVSYQYQPSSRSQSKPEAPVSSSPSRRASKDKSLPPIAGLSITTQQQSPESPGAGESGTRPSTANSLASSITRRGGPVYSRPAVALVVANSAQGRIAMPPPRSNSKSKPQPSSNLANSGDGAPYDDRSQAQTPESQPAKGHKRANTVGGADPGRFLGRLMGTSSTQSSSDRPETADRVGAGSRQSITRPSVDVARKHSEKYKDGPPVSGATKRRFSLIPAGFSLRSISGSTHQRKNSSTNAAAYAKGQMDVAGLPPSSSSYRGTVPQNPQAMSQPQLTVPRMDGRESAFSGSDTSLTPAGGSAPPSAFNHALDTPRLYNKEPRTAGPAQTPDFGGAPDQQQSYFDHSPTTAQNRKQQFMPIKSKKFQDAYEEETTAGGHGSSGPARRVMDFFRRRGVIRSKGA
ncbi:kinase-like protein [Ascodesmis nigricans]|uniref:Kinase-like protein n=1 Tax=Ascodesmis nigricans TaxID=341454 RepID=A0A4S2MJA8_9PEZI|nr:kinase-like protein [Ascodesmis nigricans]